MYILGISCFYHDSAAALIQDGRIVAAAEEERFTRIKHDFGYPAEAIDFCLKFAGITARDLDYVVFYEKPFLKFERILQSTLQTFPMSWKVFRESMLNWLGDKLWMKTLFKERLGVPEEKILFSDHHLSHAASAFYPSPYEEAAILTLDGVGEWTTTAMGIGKGTEIKLTKEIKFPHSLGLLYSAFTAFLGFQVNEGEYKVMGMAPYGKPRHVDKIYDHLIDVASDGSFGLNMDFFSYHYSDEKTFNAKFEKLFGKRQTAGDALLHFGDAVPQLLRRKAVQFRRALPGERALRRYRRQHPEGDRGGHPQARQRPPQGDGDDEALHGGRRGPEFRGQRADPPRNPVQGAVHPARGRRRGRRPRGGAPGLPRASGQAPPSSPSSTPTGGRDSRTRRCGISWKAGASNTRSIPMRTSSWTGSSTTSTHEKVVGLFQGRFEWGPRALGNRSILADPRSEEMKDLVNIKIKFREPFRPFAPVILEERAVDYFEADGFDIAGQYPSRYMILVLPLKPDKASSIKAVNHLGTGRLQTDPERMESALLRDRGKVRPGDGGARSPQHVLQPEGRADRHDPRQRFQHVQQERDRRPRPGESRRPEIGRERRRKRSPGKKWARSSGSSAGPATSASCSRSSGGGSCGG